MKHKPSKYLKRRNSTEWAKLPLPALVEVMSHLSDSERIAAAQACHHWHHAFESPILWRKRAFEFGGSRFRPLGQRTIPYAKQLGRHLRHMNVFCRQLTSHTCETMIGYLESFLESLIEHGPPILRSLEIEGLELEFWRFGELRDEVANILAKFFRSQKNLRKFRMPNAQFALLPGVNVLEAIAEGNGAKLEMLLVEFFFQSRQAVFKLNRFQSLMENFTNLHSVALNYCCLSDDLVIVWAETLKGKLKELRIRCCDNEPHDHVIAHSVWSMLTSSCPQLEVDLCVFGFGLAAEVLPILAPKIPMKSFNFFSGYDDGNELGLSTVLFHLASSYHPKLRDLSLEFDNYHDNVDEALMTTVARCKQLVSLKVKAQTDIKVARFVCQLVEEGRNALTHIDLMLCDISPLQMESLRDLRDGMGHVMQDQGVELVLRDDLYSDEQWGRSRTERL